jgi:hypothetical protein
MTNYEYAPATRRLDQPDSDWELVPSGSRKSTTYSTEAVARGRLTVVKREHEDSFDWAKITGRPDTMRFHDSEYTILRRPILNWEEYDWQKRS